MGRREQGKRQAPEKVRGVGWLKLGAVSKRRLTGCGMWKWRRPGVWHVCPQLAWSEDGHFPVGEQETGREERPQEGGYTE